jgi:hypothetical protein
LAGDVAAYRSTAHSGVAGKLTAAKAKLDRVAERHAPAHSPVWYVDVQNNRVVVLSSVPARGARLRQGRRTERRHTTVSDALRSPAGRAQHPQGALTCGVLLL